MPVPLLLFFMIWSWSLNWKLNLIATAYNDILDNCVPSTLCPPAQSQIPDLNPIQQLWDELEHDYEPDFIAQQQCWISIIVLWLNGSKSLQPGSEIYTEKWRLL